MPPRSKLPPVPKSFATKTGTTLNEKRDEWRRIIRANPARAVAVLGIGPDNPETAWGDGMLDNYPAMLQIMEAARGDAPIGVPILKATPSSKEWKGLVRAGVVEALCAWIINVRIHPDAPKEAQAPHSAFHWPLEALSNACAHIQRPPVETDKRLLSVLKDNWSAMMERLWDDPEQSLTNDEQHQVERLIVARLAAEALQQDPTVLTIIFKPDDLTIPVIARHWSHATGVDDTKTAGQVLGMLCNSNHPLHTAYASRFPVPEPTSLLDRVYIGAGPFKSSDRATRAASLIQTFAAHFTRLPLDALQIELDLFFALLRASQKHDTDELAPFLLTSGVLWKGAFGILKKSQPAQPLPPSYGPPPAPAIITLAVDVIHQAQVNKKMKECEALVRIWLDMGILNAIDNAVLFLVQYKRMTMQLTRLWVSMTQTMQDAPPGLKKLLRSQFPRWKLLGELIMNDIRHQSEDKEKMKPPPEKNPMTPDSQAWDQVCWQALIDLWKPDFDWTVCGRRGCGNRGITECAGCKEVMYCLDACQKKDAKEHKSCCMHMVIVKAVMAGQAPVSKEHDDVDRLPRPNWNIVDVKGPQEGQATVRGAPEGSLDDLA